MINKDNFIFAKKVLKDTRQTLGKHVENMQNQEMKKGIIKILKTKKVVDQIRNLEKEKVVETNIESNVNETLFNENELPFELSFGQEEVKNEVKNSVEKEYFKEKYPNDITQYFGMRIAMSESAENQVVGDRSLKEAKIQGMSIVQVAKGIGKVKKEVLAVIASGASKNLDLDAQF